LDEDNIILFLKHVEPHQRWLRHKAQ